MEMGAWSWLRQIPSDVFHARMPRLVVTCILLGVRWATTRIGPTTLWTTWRSINTWCTMQSLQTVYTWHSRVGPVKKSLGRRCGMPGKWAPSSERPSSGQYHPTRIKIRRRPSTATATTRCICLLLMNRQTTYRMLQLLRHAPRDQVPPTGQPCPTQPGATRLQTPLHVASGASGVPCNRVHSCTISVVTRDVTVS